MKLTIIGASGHGKVVADIAEKIGYDEIAFLDDDESIVSCGKWPVIGKSSEAESINDDLFIAIGNSVVREALMERYKGKRIATLIHPNAVVADDVKIGVGSVLMAGAVINPAVSVGEGCIINTCSSIDHDCVIDSFVHVSVGAHLCGTVIVGKNTWIGAGAIVSNNLTICKGCMICAGAVVIKSIMQAGTYVGVPARAVL